jgi:hypothetical protein
MLCPNILRLAFLQLLIWGALAAGSGTAEAASPWQKSCALHSDGNTIKHGINIVFDNVHLRRDNPNVPSDLEQMPNLLNFLLAMAR